MVLHLAMLAFLSNVFRPGSVPIAQEGAGCSGKEQILEPDWPVQSFLCLSLAVWL